MCLIHAHTEKTRVSSEIYTGFQGNIKALIAYMNDRMKPARNKKIYLVGDHSIKPTHNK